MISVKKIWVCMLMMHIFVASVAAYTDSNESIPWGKSKYELKSDIINFDYTKLSYPSQSISVGIKTNSENTLKERKPGRQLTTVEKLKVIANDIVSGIERLFAFIIIFLGCLAFIGLIPYYVLSFVLNLKKVVEEEMEKNKNTVSQQK